MFEKQQLLTDGSRDFAAKLEAIRRAAKHEFPTADIETMLAEIERGYESTANHNVT